MEPNQKPEAEIIAQLARDSVPRHMPLSLNQWPMECGIAPRLVWPDKAITDLEGALPRPLRKRGAARLVGVASFIAYVEKHRGTGTIITGDANEKGGSFEAILDHHEPRSLTLGDAANQPGVSSEGRPAWSEHRAELVLQPTPEWQRWLGVSGKELGQVAFAEFVEDNAPDIMATTERDPNAADLMQLATTLQVKADVRFSSKIVLQNGQTQVSYDELIDGTWGGEARLAIPQAFTIGVTPFRGCERYAVRVRLRYKASGGKAAFRLEVERPHKVVEAAFNEVAERIAQELGITVLVGALTPQTRPTI